jgi:hypothetical protein
MKAHNGMRPQDIVVLLKLISLGNSTWQQKDLANGLLMSNSEISESLNRSQISGLLDRMKKKVHRLSMMEFLEHGIKYVFPQLPGTLVTGLPTAHSHPVFASKFASEIDFVWPFGKGKVRGLAIQPLYKTVPEAALLDEKLYLLLACTDVIRVGRTREIKIAIEILKGMIL